MAQFIDLDRHCWELAAALAAIGRPYAFLSASQWLETAAGLNSVSVDLQRYDSDAGWCSAAWEYLLEREKQLARFTKDLAVFQFVWAGLEALIDESGLSEPAAPKGKVNQTCGFLTSHVAEVVAPTGYYDELAEFRRCASVLPGHDDLADRFTLQPHVGPEALGLALVYKVRNRFAHGSAAFTQRDLDEPVFDDAMLRHASRIVLLSIQMIVSVLCKGVPEIELPRRDGKNRRWSLRDLMRLLHVRPPSDAADHPSLFSSWDE